LEKRISAIRHAIFKIAPNGVINLKNNTLMSNFDNAIFKYIENENKIVPIM